MNFLGGLFAIVLAHIFKSLIVILRGHETSGAMARAFSLSQPVAAGAGAVDCGMKPQWPVVSTSQVKKYFGIRSILSVNFGNVV
jgi:hypothetical protein